MFENLTYKEKLLWAIGIIEGEGCIFTGKQKLYYKNKEYTRDIVKVDCHMSDEDIIRKLHNVFKVGLVRYEGIRKEGWKPLWLWTVNSQSEVYNLLIKIKPYLGQRRKLKCEEAIKILEPKINAILADPICRVCSCKLIEGDNWAEWAVKNNKRICKKDNSEYHKNRRKLQCLAA